MLCIERIQFWHFIWYPCLARSSNNRRKKNESNSDTYTLKKRARLFSNALHSKWDGWKSTITPYTNKSCEYFHCVCFFHLNCRKRTYTMTEWKQHDSFHFWTYKYKNIYEKIKITVNVRSDNIFSID